jgi:hypothetical protein
MGLDMFAKLVNDRASELISAGQWDELMRIFGIGVSIIIFMVGCRSCTHSRPE